MSPRARYGLRWISRDAVTYSSKFLQPLKLPQPRPAACVSQWGGTKS